ncbi:hypothetical protein CPB86DRAFT_785173 [Serendipita vermifera]|nr:hypothetical protein CPB86DRAFT_785173 [Serendipita vermifera]
MTNKASITVHPGFRGYVAGVVTAGWKQEALVELVDKETGRVLNQVIFTGQGDHQPMTVEGDGKKYWPFGAGLKKKAILNITISNYNPEKNCAEPSRIVGPLSTANETEPHYPEEVYVDTIISDDGFQNNSHDDCTISVVQYKPKA